MAIEILVLRNLLSIEDEMDGVGNLAATYLSIACPPCANLVTNVPCPIENGAVPAPVHPNGLARRKRPMLRNEQKCTKVIRSIVSKFYNPGDNVLDTFIGTFATSKECIFVTATP